MALVHAEVRLARPALGTFVDISASGAIPNEARRAVDAAFARIADVHRLMSFHDHASDVSRLNREAAQHPVTVDPSTFEVLRAALDLYRRSAGAFDIAVAPVLQNLGLLPSDRSALAGSPTATSAAIELLSDNRVEFHEPGLAIDLGGIAKGFAVDRAISVLEDAGVAAAIVNAGGDLATFGPVPRSIGIRDPNDPARIICSVVLRDRALASSARRFDPLSSDTSHSAVIDPKSRRPAAAIIGATVVAPTCLIADALTKVVMISGVRALPLLDRFNAGAMMVEHRGEVRVTSNWNSLVSLAA